MFLFRSFFYNTGYSQKRTRIGRRTFVDKFWMQWPQDLAKSLKVSSRCAKRSTGPHSNRVIQWLMLSYHFTCNRQTNRIHLSTKICQERPCTERELIHWDAKDRSRSSWYIRTQYFDTLKPRTRYDSEQNHEDTGIQTQTVFVYQLSTISRFWESNSRTNPIVLQYPRSLVLYQRCSWKTYLPQTDNINQAF